MKKISQPSNFDTLDIFQQFISHPEDEEIWFKLMEIQEEILLDGFTQSKQNLQSDESPISELIQQLQKVNTPKTVELIGILEPVSKQQPSSSAGPSAEVLGQYIRRKKPYSNIAILALGHLGVKNDQILELLKKILNDGNYPDYQLCAAESLLRLELVEGTIEKISEVIVSQMNSGFEDCRLAASRILPLFAKFAEL